MENKHLILEFLEFGQDLLWGLSAHCNSNSHPAIAKSGTVPELVHVEIHYLLVIRVKNAFDCIQHELGKIVNVRLDGHPCLGSFQG